MNRKQKYTAILSTTTALSLALAIVVLGKRLDVSCRAMTSVIMLRHPRPFSRGWLLMPCLVQLCLTLLVISDLNSFSFVQSASLDHRRANEAQVRLGSARKRQADSRQLEAASEAEAQQFTVAIRKAPTSKNLIETLDWVVDGPIFNLFHASAAYMKLVELSRRRSLEETDWESPVLLRLHARVQDMVRQNQLNARAFSNVLWSIAKVSNRFGVPAELLTILVKSVPSKAKEDMNQQDFSNILLALAHLKGAAPVVLEAVPAVAELIPSRAKGMRPQESSNCLWACLRLQNDVPEVLKIVPPIAVEILSKIKNMNAQQLCNSLDALILLRESVPEAAACLPDNGGEDGVVRSAADHLAALLPKLTGTDLNVAVPAVVWACAKVGVHHDELLASVAERLGSRTRLSPLKDFGLSALYWSYQVLDPEDGFAGFRKLLKSEISRRRLSEVDVESSKLGYLKWSRAKA